MLITSLRERGNHLAGQFRICFLTNSLCDMLEGYGYVDIFNVTSVWNAGNILSWIQGPLSACSEILIHRIGLPSSKLFNFFDVDSSLE